jgi:signal transduction histidine kinase
MTRSKPPPESEPPPLAPTDEARRLRASRARLVAAEYAERRRIERTLHDGVQQHLVALAVNLQLARQLAETDPPAVSPVLNELARDVREALEGVRELAHEIYPPLLLDRGLSEAIDAASSVAALPTRVEVAALNRYPEDVEATVYFCCLDALRAAAARAGARATVRIWQDRGTVNFTVADDGRGIDSRSHIPGSELCSMHDRIGAVGGRLTVVAGPEGGTCVTGTIPLGS